MLHPPERCVAHADIARVNLQVLFSELQLLECLYTIQEVTLLVNCRDLRVILTVEIYHAPGVKMQLINSQKFHNKIHSGSKISMKLKQWNSSNMDALWQNKLSSLAR